MMATVSRSRAAGEAAGLDLGEVQQVADNLGQRAAGALDQVQATAAFGGQAGILADQGGEAQDAVERGADLVADRGQEIGLGLVGGLGAALRGAGDGLAADQQGLQALLPGQGQGGGQADGVEHQVEHLGLADRPDGDRRVQAELVDDGRDRRGQGGGGDDGDGARAAPERGQQGGCEQQHLQGRIGGEHDDRRARHQQGAGDLLERLDDEALGQAAVEEDQHGGNGQGRAQRVGHHPVFPVGPERLAGVQGQQAAFAQAGERGEGADHHGQHQQAPHAAHAGGQAQQADQRGRSGDLQQIQHGDHQREAQRAFDSEFDRQMQHGGCGQHHRALATVQDQQSSHGDGVGGPDRGQAVGRARQEHAVGHARDIAEHQDDQASIRRDPPEPLARRYARAPRHAGQNIEQLSVFS
jgi:hypothetical protein